MLFYIVMVAPVSFMISDTFTALAAEVISYHIPLCHLCSYFINTLKTTAQIFFFCRDVTIYMYVCNSDSRYRQRKGINQDLVFSLAVTLHKLSSIHRDLLHTRATVADGLMTLNCVNDVR